MPKHIVQSESQIVSAKWSKWSDIPKKAAVLMDFVRPNSPLPLPPNQKRQFKRHSKLLIIQNSSQIKAENVLCGSCIQPKKQFKVQIIGILEEVDSFY